MIFEKFVSLFQRNPFRSLKKHVEPENTTRYIRNEEEFMHYLKPYIENLAHGHMQTFNLESGKCSHCGKRKMLEPVFAGGRTTNEVLEGLIQDLLDLSNRFRFRFLEMYWLEEMFWIKYLGMVRDLLLLCERCSATYKGRMRYSDYHKDHIDFNQRPGYWPYRKRVFNKEEMFFFREDSMFSLIVKTLGSVLVTNRITEEEVERLQDPEYCRQNFGRDLPVLLKVEEEDLRAGKYDTEEYDLYCKGTADHLGSFYLMLAECWTDNSRELYMDWLIRNFTEEGME